MIKHRLKGAFIVPVAILLDQLTKHIFAGTTSAVRNSGMAFSLLSGQGQLLLILTAVMLILLTAWLLWKPDELSYPARLGLFMIVGGGIGNWIDRVRFGEVIDFIELPYIRFAIFNVADVFVVAGAILTAAALLFGRK